MKLPPAHFHVLGETVSIGFWFSVRSNEAANKNVCSQAAIVGLTGDQEWLAGNDVLNMDKNILKGSWKLSDCISKCDWQEEITSVQGVSTLTGERLFAIFFKTFKVNIESEHNGIVDIAVIAIPYWLSSYHRLLIKNAAKIAGFLYVILVNENSVSALFVSIGDSFKSWHEIVILSENSNRVDISLFQKNVGNKLTLLGHAGDYETGDLQKDSFVKKFFAGILLYLLSNEKPTDNTTAADEALFSLWKLVLKRAGFRTLSSSPYVLLCFESEKWKPLLFKLANQITKKPFVFVRNDIVQEGLFYITNSKGFDGSFQVQSLIVDGIPYNLKLETPGGKQICLKKKENSVAITGKKFLSPVETICSGRYTIFQENFIHDPKLAYVIVTNIPKNVSRIRFNIHRYRNGIVQLETIDLGDYWENFHYVQNINDKSEFISLVSCCLTQEEILSMKTWLSQIKIETLATKKIRSVSKGLELASKIKIALETGKVQIKSNLLRNLAFESIDEACLVLNQQNVAQKELDAQVEILRKLAIKYNIK